MLLWSANAFGAMVREHERIEGPNGKGREGGVATKGVRVAVRVMRVVVDVSMVNPPAVS